MLILQDKVRSESPCVLSGRYTSPREMKWQNEKKELKREIQQLQAEVMSKYTTSVNRYMRCLKPWRFWTIQIERLKTSQLHEDIVDLSGSLSPPSEKTELYLKEKLRALSEVKVCANTAVVDFQINVFAFWIFRTLKYLDWANKLHTGWIRQNLIQRQMQRNERFGCVFL